MVPVLNVDEGDRYMTEEAVPIEFQGSEPVKSVAEEVNKLLKAGGTFVGYIAVGPAPSRHTGPAPKEGVVGMIDRPEQEAESAAS